MLNERIALRADRGPEQLRSHNRRGRIAEVSLEVVHEVDVAIARQDDGVLRGREPVQDHLAVSDVSHPIVDAVEDVLSVLRTRVLLREAHRLRHEVPTRRGVSQSVQKPAALIRPQHRPRRVDARRAVARRRLVRLSAERDFRRAVLARVEDEECREPAVAQAPVELEVGTLRPRSPHGHVLVERLIARGPLGERGMVARIFPGDAARVVVFDLMIVPRDDPRERGVRRLKVPIRLVLRVAVAVVGKREAPAPLAVVANDVAARRPLVDVIAEEEDRIEIFSRETRVRGVVPLGVVLA